MFYSMSGLLQVKQKLQETRVKLEMLRSAAAPAQSTSRGPQTPSKALVQPILSESFAQPALQEAVRFHCAHKGQFAYHFRAFKQQLPACHKTSTSPTCNEGFLDPIKAKLMHLAASHTKQAAGRANIQPIS